VGKKIGAVARVLHWFENNLTTESKEEPCQILPAFASFS
jgi:hypothetical protein